MKSPNPQSELPAELFVISDLHIGGKYGDTSSSRGFRINTHVKDLVNFVSELEQRARQGKGRLELVINGDFVDFLAEEGPGPEPWRAFIESEEEAVETLETIVRRDIELFEALARLLQSGATLTLVLGNHDIELSRPAVRSCLSRRLKATRASAFQFVYDSEAYVVGDVLIEHGNRYDGWNTIDFDTLRRLRSEESRGLPVSPEAKFTAPAGSQMVSEVMNVIKKNYAFVDLLKPETEAAIPLLLALEPGYARTIDRLETLHRLQAEAADGAPRAPARPSRPENIAGAAASVHHAGLDDLLARQMGPRERKRLQTLVQEAETESGQASERIAGVSIRQSLSFARALLMKDWEKRLPTLLDSLRAWQTEGLFDLSRETTASYLDAATELASRGFSTVVFGHTHLAKEVRLGKNGKYLNTGTWADFMRLPAEITEGSRPVALAELKRFAEAMRTNQFGDYVEFAPTFGYIRWDQMERSIATIKRYEAGMVKSL